MASGPKMAPKNQNGQNLKKKNLEGKFLAAAAAQSEPVTRREGPIFRSENAPKNVRMCPNFCDVKKGVEKAPPVTNDARIRLCDKCQDLG